VTHPETIFDRVRRAVIAGDDVDRAVDVEVRRANETALGARSESELDVASVRHVVAGFGALQPLLDDDSVEEIWINAPDSVFVARAGRHEPVAVELARDAIRTLVERMLQSSGRRVDLSQPFVDAALPDGSRLHVAIPPITRSEWSVNIRKFPSTVRTLDTLVASGTLDRAAAQMLTDAIRDGATVLVSGATQAGKTTMLCALLDCLEATERVVTVEETFEIATRLPDVVGLQCRAPSIEGTGEITLRRLVKEALRMRPTRLVVGEVRGDESLDLLVALNSGLPGLCTIHANSANDAVRKLLTLCLLAGNIGAEFASTVAVDAIDLVVHCAMAAGGRRSITEIIAPRSVAPDGAIQSEVLWTSSS
jgi:pilus assembly protein CpaF